jgi:RND family efflux transporter MFP subunit
MKNLILIITCFALVSCLNEEKSTTKDLIVNENVVGLEQKRSRLVGQIEELRNELSLVTGALNRLDTTKKRAMVSVLTVKPREFKHRISLQSIVKTDQNILLQPEFMGAVSSISVREGQNVKKGQILLRIDDGGLKQTMRLQKVQTALAKTIYERQERLWTEKIGSEIEYLQAKTNYESQNSQLAQLNKQLEKAVVRAPFTGKVDDIMVEVGQVVSPGVMPLLRIVSTQKMYVEADVPERFLTTVSKGTPVRVDIPVLSTSFDALISHRATHVSTENRTFRVTVDIDPNINVNPNLLSTLHIFDYINPQALLIPGSVISENASGKEFVFVINKDNQAQKVFIQTGYSENGMVEVTQGLEDGATIISEGARLVKENQPVQIIE